MNQYGENFEGTRPALTLTEAAEATGAHRNTIRRRLDADRFPNAFRGADGQWRVPVNDLIASGLKLHRPGMEAEQGSTPVLAETAEVGRLRAEVAEWRRRAEVAQAEARERERALGIAERALRALTEGERRAEPESTVVPSATPGSMPGDANALLPRFRGLFRRRPQ